MLQTIETAEATDLYAIMRKTIKSREKSCLAMKLVMIKLMMKGLETVIARVRAKNSIQSMNFDRLMPISPFMSCGTEVKFIFLYLMIFSRE